MVTLRKAGLAALAVAAGCAAVAGWSGCAWAVHPQSGLADPAPVYLVEHGRHTRVAVPFREGEFVEYGFGDWRFYGLEDRGAGAALSAAAGFGTPARSRRVLATPPADVDFAKWSGGTRSATLAAERAAVRQFVERMEREWREIEHGARVRARDGVTVAPVETPRYHLFRNSNHFTADNLRALGFRVTGFPVTSNFEVADPE